MWWLWFKNKTLRPLLIHRVLELLLIAIVGVIVVVGSDYVASVRRETLIAQRQLQQRPDTAIIVATAGRQLEDRQHDIDRIEAYLLSDDGVAEFVGALEEAAGRRSVTLEVTTVAEAIALDENQRPIPPSGPLKEIRLSLIATGEPPQLVTLLHELEHLPYLASVSEWAIRAEARGTRGSSALVPDRTGAPAPPPDSATQPGGILEADILLSVHSNAN